MNETFTDSAGTTCTYTPIEDLKKGDVVILGWRTTVHHVEIDAANNRARVVWEGREEYPDQWNPLGSLMPKEVSP